jgi:hypothetical protein
MRHAPSAQSFNGAVKVVMEGEKGGFGVGPFEPHSNEC